ncbi:MAG: hypothetical protein AABW73_04090 [Nanoarchaeota archaeon]
MIFKVRKTREIMESKKGELTSGQIIVVIILVLSFAAVLFFYNLLDFDKQVDRDVCEATIAARGAARYDEIFELGPTSIPLKCKTEKYCISDSENLDGKCAGLPQTEDNPVKAQVLKKEGSTLREVREEYLDFLSEQLYSCNQLLGEGEINFLPTKSWDKSYCLICSRIEVDEKYRDEIGKVTYLELYKHMEEKMALDGKSYLEHLGMIEAEKALSNILESIKKTAEDSDDKQFASTMQRTTLNNWYLPEGQFAIISMMHIDGNLEEVVSGVGTGIAVGGVIIAGVFSGGATWAALPFLIGGTVVGVGAGATAGGFVYALGSRNNDFEKGDQEGEYFYLPPTIHSYDSKTINALGCNSFETAP